MVLQQVINKWRQGINDIVIDIDQNSINSLGPFCLEKFKWARNEYIKLGKLLTGNTFKDVCSLIEQYINTNDRSYYDQAVAIIMGLGLGYDEDHAKHLLISVFKPELEPPPGFTW